MINFKRLLLAATLGLSLFLNPVFADFNSDKAEILTLLAEGQAVSADNLTAAEKERMAVRFCDPQIKPLILSQITSVNTELLIWSLGTMTMPQIKGLAAAAKAELISLNLPNSAEYQLLIGTLDQVIAFPGTVAQLQAVLLANEATITSSALTAADDFINYACAESGYTTLIQLGEDSAGFLTAQSANILAIINNSQGTTPQGQAFAAKTLAGLKLSRKLYLSSIGNRVWIDTNGNGILEDGTNGSTDLGEVGIDGVTVELLDDTGAIIDTTVTYTGANNGKLGYYKFTDLMASRFSTASDYKIRVILPSGYIITTKAGAGIADDNMSDANVADFTTDAITLEYADTMNKVDIGIMDPEGPVITGVTTTDPATYTVGDTISFEVTFDQIVDVAGGAPDLKFKAPDNLTVKAAYVSGTGTDTLVFEYTFTANDNINDWDGIEVPAKNLVKNGATIENSTDDEANYMVPATDFAGIKIDTAIPEWDKIEITSDEGVVIGNIRYLPDGAAITSYLFITENDTRESASVGLSIGGAAEQVENTLTSDTGHDKDAQKTANYSGLGEVALGSTFTWTDFAGNDATGTPTFIVNDSDPAVDTYIMGPVPAMPTTPVVAPISELPPVLRAGNGNPHNTFGKYKTAAEWRGFNNRLRYGVRPQVLTYINRNGFEVFRGYRYGILGWDRPTTKRFQNEVRYRASYHERERGLVLNDRNFAKIATLSERIHTMQDTYQKDFAPMEYKSDDFKEALKVLKPLKRISSKDAYKGILTRNAQKVKVNVWEHRRSGKKIMKRDPYARNLKVIKMRLPNGQSIRIERVIK